MQTQKILWGMCAVKTVLGQTPTGAAPTIKRLTVYAVGLLALVWYRTGARYIKWKLILYFFNPTIRLLAQIIYTLSKS